MNSMDISIGPKTVEDLNSSVQDRVMKQFPGIGIIASFNPGKYMIPAPFKKYHESVFNFKFRSDDLLVMVYPRCGSSWTQEIVWTMRYNPNLDHPTATKPILIRSPIIESDMYFDLLEDNPYKPILQASCPGFDSKDGIILQTLDSMIEKRVMKTHLPLSFFNPSLLDTCKIVFVTRDPRDMILSYYHLSRFSKVMNFTGSFDDFVNVVIDDEILHGPFWEMMREALEQMDHPNMLCIKYEEMVAEPLKHIQKINHFIGSNLDEKQMHNIAHFTSFAEMKKRLANELPQEMIFEEKAEKEGGYFRQGKSGKGKEALTEEQKIKIDKWIEKNTRGKRDQFSKFINF